MSTGREQIELYFDYRQYLLWRSASLTNYTLMNTLTRPPRDVTHEDDDVTQEVTQEGGEDGGVAAAGSRVKKFPVFGHCTQVVIRDLVHK